MTWEQRSLRAAGFAMGAVIFLGMLLIMLAVMNRVLPLTYLYCCVREDAWKSAESQEELEARIHVPHTKRVIQPTSPAAASYGVDADLGERLVRYEIFSQEPLAAVVEADGGIKALYTLYE